MGISAVIDPGIGTFAIEGYVRITKVVYHADAEVVDSIDPFTSHTEPEWEISIATYFNKECRDFEAVKEYVINVFMKSASYLRLDESKKEWINSNILARVGRPLQELSFATRLIDSFPSPQSSQAEVYAFFYAWIKEHTVFGPVYSDIKDEATTSEEVIASFKTQYRDIFGG
jgi:hypothetical protein